MRGPRGGGRGSGGAVAGGLAAQSRTQAMLDNWEKDPAKEAAKKLERDRQEKLRKSNEEKEIQKSLQKLKAKEALLRRGEDIQKEAQRIESERLAIQERERERHSRLLRENPSYRGQFAKEQARVKAQAEEKARREAEEKARREAEAKAQAPKQANQAKDIPSLWHSLTTSLLQQNFQNTNQQARLPEKTDDKKENSLQNWMALFSGLLKKQEEEKPELPPQKYPPPIDIPKPIGGQEIAPATTAPSNPIPQGPKTKASEYYSHSLDICRLQSKFDENHNISYNSIKDKTYFDQRVAKWDAELKDIGLKTAPPRRQDEQRLMGFEGYIKYLDSNIKQLQTQELTQEELKNGKNPSVNQQKLKTLIAFHYLEMAKAFYSSGQLHMDGIEEEYFKKESVFDMVPRKYKEHLTERNTSINSYRLPGVEKENIINEVLKIESLIKNYFPKEHLGRMPQSVWKEEGNTKLNPSTSVFKRISDKIVAGREYVNDQAREDYYYMNGPQIASALNSAKEGVTKAVGFVGRGADAVAEGMVLTGRRVKPNTSLVPQDNFVATKSCLGYSASGSDVRAHDSRLRKEQDQASKLRRDTQPDALFENRVKREEEINLAMRRQALGRNFYGPYNATHGGRNGGR